MRSRNTGWLVLALCVGGCGQRLVPVEGTVTLDGQILPYKTVVFVPAAGTAGRQAAGETNGDGKYSLITSTAGDDSIPRRGIVPGRYSVAIYAVPRWPEPRRRSEIPAIYTSEASTPLLVDVTRSGGVFDLQLSSPAESDSSADAKPDRPGVSTASADSRDATSP